MSKNDYNLLIQDPEDIKRYWKQRNTKYKPKEITTTNLEDFGYSERMDLIRLLTAWNEHGLPDDFDSEGVHAMMNKESGNVFLTNDEFQVAMMNGDKLESFYNCVNCGHEGFLKDCCNECMEYDRMRSKR